MIFKKEQRFLGHGKNIPKPLFFYKNSEGILCIGTNVLLNSGEDRHNVNK